MIPREECVTRGVYAIESRNLTHGVYDGQGGFIGIRSKFGDLFLFTEYHYDGNGWLGTVRPASLIEMLPPEIELFERESRCLNCKSLVVHVQSDPADYSRGEWIHLRNVACQRIDPRSQMNMPLYLYLSELPQRG